MNLKFNLHLNVVFQLSWVSFPCSGFLSFPIHLIWLTVQDALSHGQNLDCFEFVEIAINDDEASTSIVPPPPTSSPPPSPTPTPASTPTSIPCGRKKGTMRLTQEDMQRAVEGAMETMRRENNERMETMRRENNERMETMRRENNERMICKLVGCDPSHDYCLTTHGHTEAVLSVSFSPDGRNLASGSGDTTVRLWDLNTQTPLFTCTGHKNWVLCIAWSPDGKHLVSGSKTGELLCWDPLTGKQSGNSFSGHKKWITGISWEPAHLKSPCRRFFSGLYYQSMGIYAGEADPGIEGSPYNAEARYKRRLKMLTLGMMNRSNEH